MISKQILCQCELPLLWNDKFDVYLCIHCGDLADKDGILMEISPEEKTKFIEKIKSLQKKFLEISLIEEQLKTKSTEQN